MSKPRLLDLFCGAGGCSVGYARAGFEVTGVDIAPQPDYPFFAFEADALDFLGQHIALLDRGVPFHFDAIHASPPCQAYTSLTRLGKGAGEGAVDLVGQTRELLERAGVPYVIENVEGSPLRNPTRICGTSLGLDVRRHRLFETNWPMMTSPCAHGQGPRPIAVYGDHPQDGSAGHINRAKTLEEAQRAMDIDWMPWRSLTQAIPPAYTELIGHQLLAHIKSERRVAA